MHFMVTAPLEHIYFCDPAEIFLMNCDRLSEVKT